MIHFVAGWFVSWLLTLKQRLFLNPYEKNEWENTAGTKAAENVGGRCCTLISIEFDVNVAQLQYNTLTSINKAHANIVLEQSKCYHLNMKLLYKYVFKFRCFKNTLHIFCTGH